MSGPISPGLNGAGKPEEHPLCLVLVGGQLLIGPCRDNGDGRVVLRDPGVYVGQVQIARLVTERGKIDVQIQRAVTPISGLTSLRAITVFPQSVITLDELDARERKEIAQAYGNLLELYASVRRSVSAIAPVGRIVPGS